MDRGIEKALGSLAYGLYIVTAKFSGKRNAMVASWVSQVSHDPPRIMVAIRKNRYTHSLISSARAFGLMVVEHGRERELSRFKGPDPEEKFTGLDVREGKSGSPLFPDFFASFDLVVIHEIDAGDHTIFIGEIRDAIINDAGRKPSTTIDYGKGYTGSS